MCYTEIIDWPGGQMISGMYVQCHLSSTPPHLHRPLHTCIPTLPVLVPAWDMGSLNWMAENQPSSYRDLYHHLAGNPGACLVSLKCYEPNKLVQSW